MSDYKISEIRDIDIASQWQSYCRLLQQLTSLNMDLVTEDGFRERLNLITSNINHKIYLAVKDTEVIATLTLLIEPKFIHEFGSTGHIEDVVVLNQERGQGLGKILVDHAVTEARRLGCYKIILDCNDANIGFYERSGFKVKERQMVLYL